jgi:hypothetical protein
VSRENEKDVVGYTREVCLPGESECPAHVGAHERLEDMK